MAGDARWSCFFGDMRAQSACGGTAGTAIAVFSVAKRRNRLLNFSVSTIYTFTGRSGLGEILEWGDIEHNAGK